MTVDLKNPAGVATPVAFYSHLAVISGADRILALAGQVGQRLDGSFPDTVEEQFEQAIRNVLAIVASEGGDATAVARLTCYLTERPADATKFREIMSVFPTGFPAMSFIYVAGLFAPHVKVEVEAIAAL